MENLSFEGRMLLRGLAPRQGLILAAQLRELANRLPQEDRATLFLFLNLFAEQRQELEIAARRLVKMDSPAQTYATLCGLALPEPDIPKAGFEFDLPRPTPRSLP